MAISYVSLPGNMAKKHLGRGIAWKIANKKAMRVGKYILKNMIWLVVSTRLKNMKVSWDDCSEYMET